MNPLQSFLATLEPELRATIEVAARIMVKTCERMPGLDMGWAILWDGKVAPCDAFTASVWMDRHNVMRTVGEYKTDDDYVVTSFCCVPFRHRQAGFDGGRRTRPLHFETMIGSACVGHYATLVEAQAGHQKAVRRVRIGADE